MSVLSEINRIKGAVTATANAIKDKGVTVPTNVKIADLAPLVSSIPQLDASSADALPSQVVDGAKFVGANGVVEEGTLKVFDCGSYAGFYDDFDAGEIYIRTPLERGIYEDGFIDTRVQASEFGNATASDVREGATFTSSAGVKETGTMPDGDYSVRMGLSGEEGYVNVEGTNVTLNEESTKPSSGYYIKAIGLGKVSACGEAVIHTTGYIEKGSKMVGGEDIENPDGSLFMWSGPETKYYTIATEEKTATPSESSVSVTPSSNKLLSKVTVNAIPTTYVGSGVARKSSSDLTASGATVTAPAGYYAEAATKTISNATFEVSGNTVKTTSSGAGYVASGTTVGTVATATQATPKISVSASGSITASATQTAGYVSAGTKAATKQLTVQAAKTVTPTTSDITAVEKSVYTTGTVKVKGDANLVAGNIKKDVTIFGVTGTHEGGASIATCIVTVTFSTSAGATLISATTFANGTISAVNHNLMAADAKSGKSVSISNVVCGSALSINTGSMTSLYWSDSQENHYGLQGGTITVPTTPNLIYTVEVGMLDD